jgi:hypothetical protein
MEWNGMSGIASSSVAEWNGGIASGSVAEWNEWNGME